MSDHRGSRRAFSRRGARARTWRPDPGRRWHRLLRASGALFLVATGAEHLELNLAAGYGHIPAIGPLFLFQAVGAIGLGLVVLATPLPLVSLAGALFALATLGGYLLSLGVGLFGFHEVVTAAGIASGLMDIAAFSLLAFVGVSGPGWTGHLGKTSPSGKLVPRLVPRLVVVPVALAALAAFSVELAQASPAGGVASATAGRAVGVVGTVRIADYGRVLATARGRSLYLLRTARGAPAPCRDGCRSIWPPLLVASSVHRVRAGPGVRGTIGLVPRDGEQQVTDNGYPLYTFAGDTARGQSNGEGIASFGGTWDLVRASATRAATTAVQSTR